MAEAVPLITEKEALAVVPKGSFLDAYVQYAIQCTDAHAAYHIAGGLMTLAQTLPMDLGIPFGDSAVFGNIFALTVGSSGERKTEALKICRSLLEAANVGYIAEHPGSQQACVDEIRDHPQQVIVYEDFGAMLAAAEKGYLVPLKTTLTQAYDGGDIGRALVKRRGQGPIKKTRVSLFGAVTPEYLGRYTESTDWEGGFFNRFLFLYAKQERDWSRRPHKVTGRAALVDRLQVLTALDTMGSSPEGYAPATKPIFDEWYYALRKRLSNDLNVSGVLARAGTLVDKLALIFAWDFGGARSGQQWYVTEAELIPALKIVDLHIRSVMNLSPMIAPSKVIRDRIAVLKCIGHQPISAGAIITKSKVGLKKYVNEILTSLEEEKLICRAATPDNRNDYWILAPSNAREEADNVVRLFKPAPTLDTAEEVRSAQASLEDPPDLDV